jgi:hypothetical protein
LLGVDRPFDYSNLQAMNRTRPMARLNEPFRCGKVKILSPLHYVLASLLLLLGACSSSTGPLVTDKTDKTGWLLVGTVMNYNVPEVYKRLWSQGIPAWCDPRGYPCYPVTSPPEHSTRARVLIDDLLLGNHRRAKSVNALASPRIDGSSGKLAH